MLDFSNFIVTQEMLSLLTEIDQFKASWQFLQRITPYRLQTLKKVATIESIGSSTRIEGSKLSDREVTQLITNINDKSFISRDEQEVAGYSLVCEEVFSNWEIMNFSENTVKHLHGWLLKYSEKDERHRGEYKKLINNVEAFNSEGKSLGVIFETASPFEVPFKMEELIRFTKEHLSDKTLHPLIIIGIFVVVFLAIHPFQDGNGRLSRILTTLLLLKAGYLYVSYSSLESIIERNKESYYLALRRTQSSMKLEKKDFDSWILFFLRSLQKQKLHLEQKIGLEQQMMLQMTALSYTILELIQEHGKLNIAQIETLTKANRNTIKKTIAKLTAQHHILQLGKGRGTWYTL